MRKLLFLIGILCLTFVSALDVSEQYDNDVIVLGVDNPIKLILAILAEIVQTFYMVMI